MRTHFLLILLLILGGLHSCLKDKPDSLPGKLEWNPDLAFPIGGDQFGLNAKSGFDTTLFEYDTITNLPKWVGKIEVIMEGRVDFDLSVYEEATDKINRILFRVLLNNGFPNVVEAQAYFIDAQNLFIDSMFSGGGLPLSAGIPIGDTINPSMHRKDAVFEKERIDNILNAKEILLRAVIRNQVIDTTLIPYYRSYYLDLEVGMMTDISLEF